MISPLNAISVEHTKTENLSNPEKAIKINIKTFHLYGQTPHETGGLLSPDYDSDNTSRETEWGDRQKIRSLVLT